MGSRNKQLDDQHQLMDDHDEPLDNQNQLIDVHGDENYELKWEESSSSDDEPIDLSIPKEEIRHSPLDLSIQREGEIDELNIVDDNDTPDLIDQSSFDVLDLSISYRREIAKTLAEMIDKWWHQTPSAKCKKHQHMQKTSAKYHVFTIERVTLMRHKYGLFEIGE